MTNQTNLRKLRGNTIKQGDTVSIFEYKLNANGQALNGSATVQLINFDDEKYEFEADVVDNKVSFQLRDVLPEGIYTLEIEHAGYVFPSDNSATVTINRNLADYAEDVIALQKISDEIKKQLANYQADSIDLEELAQKLNVASYDDSSLRVEISRILGEIERLKSSEGKTTSYDDSELRGLISALSERVNQPLVLTEEQKEELRGPKGEQGPQGERGEKGDAGTVDVAILANYVTKEELKKYVNQVASNGDAQPRYAPTGWSLDRSVTPWQIRFDNGSSLTLGDVDKRAYIYSESQPITIDALSEYRVVLTLIRTANGSTPIESWSTANGVARFWGKAEVTNPLHDSSMFDFSKAQYNSNDTNGPSRRAQHILIRCYYELGVFTVEDILSFGAVRK